MAHGRHGQAMAGLGECHACDLTRLEDAERRLARVAVEHQRLRDAVARAVLDDANDPDAHQALVVMTERLSAALGEA